VKFLVSSKLMPQNFNFSQLLWILDFMAWLVTAILWPPVMIKFLKFKGLHSFEQSEYVFILSLLALAF